MNREQLSISRLLRELQDAQSDEANKLLDYCYKVLMRMVCLSVGDHLEHKTGRESIVQLALVSFWSGLESGRFPKLKNRNDLWQVLAMLVRNKRVDRERFWHADVRDVSREQPIKTHDPSSQSHGVSWDVELVGNELDPVSNLEADEEYNHLLHTLDELGLRETFQWKLEGYTHREIATMANRSLTTIEGRARLIRKLVAQYLESRARSS